jgi:thioredoxin type arsenate reductase
MKNVLFLCVANSARSQMAEGIARHILGKDLNVSSAGSMPSSLNPHAVSVLSEIGIDISNHYSKSVDDIDTQNIDAVITLCADEVCPVFLGNVKRFHWPLTDPAATHINEEDALEKFREIRDQLVARIEVMAELVKSPEGIESEEFHGSIRVSNLARSTAFYAWLLNSWPKDWTHRYATFIRPDLNLNFVLVVADGKSLNHDTLYHLGIAVSSKQAVIAAFTAAKLNGFTVVKPPRTTWKGTPLHELWLADPDGNLIEIYARLTDSERLEKPEDNEPTFLVAGTREHYEH